jgi:hypothetical protein
VDCTHSIGQVAMSQSKLKLSVARNVTSAGKRVAYSADEAFMTVVATNTGEIPITITHVYLQVCRNWWERLHDRWRLVELAADASQAVYPYVVEAKGQWRARWHEDIVNSVSGPWAHTYLRLRTNAEPAPSMIRIRHEPRRVKAGSG